MFLSLIDVSLSPPHPLSLKSINISLGEDLKKNNKLRHREMIDFPEVMRLVILTGVKSVLSCSMLILYYQTLRPVLEYGFVS